MLHLNQSQSPLKRLRRRRRRKRPPIYDPLMNVLRLQPPHWPQTRKVWWPPLLFHGIALLHLDYENEKLSAGQKNKTPKRFNSSNERLSSATSWAFPLNKKMNVKSRALGGLWRSRKKGYGWFLGGRISADYELGQPVKFYNVLNANKVGVHSLLFFLGCCVAAKQRTLMRCRDATRLWCLGGFIWEPS